MDLRKDLTLYMCVLFCLTPVTFYAMHINLNASHCLDWDSVSVRRFDESEQPCPFQFGLMFSFNFDYQERTLEWRFDKQKNLNTITFIIFLSFFLQIGFLFLLCSSVFCFQGLLRFVLLSFVSLFFLFFGTLNETQSLHVSRRNTVLQCVRVFAIVHWFSFEVMYAKTIRHGRCSSSYGPKASVNL